MKVKIKKAKDGRANNRRPKKLQDHEKKKHVNLYVRGYVISDLGGEKAVQKISENAVEKAHKEFLNSKNK